MPNENETDQPATNPPTPAQPDSTNELPQFPPNEFVRGDFGDIGESIPDIQRRDDDAG